MVEIAGTLIVDVEWWTEVRDGIGTGLDLLLVSCGVRRRAAVGGHMESFKLHS